MKVYFIIVGQWTSLLLTLLLVSGTLTQMDPTLEDLVTLCNKGNEVECEWLETYKRQTKLNDLSQKTGDGSRYRVYKYRHQVNPQETYNEYNKDPPLVLFGSGYKSQYNRIYSPISGPPGKQQSRKPFNYDNKRARYAFSSWGGKRASDETDSTNTKREPAFSSWGGKRTQKFFNWGGKRSISDSEMQQVMDDNNDHNIMKRNAETPYKSEDDREKRLCITESMNLQDLFREFVEWSRKQPEQKKGALYRKIFSANVPTLHSPDNLSRRAGTFYQWGGKRGIKQN